MTKQLRNKLKFDLGIKTPFTKFVGSYNPPSKNQRTNKIAQTLEKL